MTFLLIVLLMLLAGILIPAGIVLGLVLGIKLLFWWLDRALTTDDTE